MALCPRCGRRVPAESDFCPYCNEDIIYSKRNSSKRNQSLANKSKGHSENASRQKRIENENKKLRKNLNIMFIATIGMTILAIILGIAFITTAMNVSSISLKAKNTEEKLEMLIEENNKLKSDLGINSTNTSSEKENPFKDDIEAAHATTVADEKPIIYTEETTTQTTVEETTQETTQLQTTTQQQTTQETTQLQNVTEEKIETTTKKEEVQSDAGVAAPSNNNIESYSPIIPD